MAKEGNILPWVLGVSAVGFFVYKGYVKPNIIAPIKLVKYTTRLRVNLPAVRMKGDNVEFDLYIQNPNPNALTINAVVGDVFVITNYKTYKLGNIDKYGDVVIKPTGETKFTFSIRQRFLGFLAYFSDIRDGKIKHQTLSFVGTITVDKRPWPVKESLKIS